MTTMSYESFVAEGGEAVEPLVVVEREAHHAIVRLDDPDKLNVLSAPMMAQLRQATEALVRDPAVRSIVLTGTDPGFCTGGDLRMMQRAVDMLGAEDRGDGAGHVWRWIREQFGGMARLIAGSNVAFIAAINGPAAGVGLAFALTCDIVIASDRAVLVPAFGRLGLIPEVGTSWALTRKLGYQGAFEFYVRGDHLSAQEAAEVGLVGHVVPHDELLDAARVWCDRVAQLPPHALRMSKTLLRGVADLSWDEALRLEEFAEPTCFTSSAFAQSVETMLGGDRAQGMR